MTTKNNETETRLDQTGASRLRFDSRDDALNYANKVVEDGNRWLSEHTINISERYERLNLVLDLGLRSMRTIRNYHLIFHSIPLGWECADPNRTAKVTSCCTGIDCDGSDDCVFVGITKLVQGPKKVIASLVWLKRNHQVKDFFRQIFGPTGHATLYFTESIPKGEMGFTSFGFGSYPDKISSLIESGTQTDKSVKSNSGQIDWHGFNEFDFMYILSSIRISLDDRGVWVGVEENSNFCFQVTNVSLGVIDAVS